MPLSTPDRSYKCYFIGKVDEIGHLNAAFSFLTVDAQKVCDECSFAAFATSIETAPDEAKQLWMKLIDYNSRNMLPAGGQISFRGKYNTTVGEYTFLGKGFEKMISVPKIEYADLIDSLNKFPDTVEAISKSTNNSSSDVQMEYVKICQGLSAVDKNELILELSKRIKDKRILAEAIDAVINKAKTSRLKIQLIGKASGGKIDGRRMHGDWSTYLVDENGNVSSGRCGLTELLAFVDAVDNVRVAEGCDTAIETQLKEWCTPTDGSKEAYPWNCRQWGLTDLTRNVYNFAVDVCADPTNNAPKPNFSAEATLAQLKSAMQGYGAIALATQNKIDQAINEIRWQLEYKFIEKCEELNGYWIDADVLASDNGGKWTGTADLTAFYTALYGKGSGSTVKGAEEWGRCVENTTRVLCEAYNSNVIADKSDVDENSLSVPLAIYDAATDECKFSAEWYQRQCQLLGNGYYENGVCYVAPEN